jgi:hypothetical protein
MDPFLYKSGLLHSDPDPKSATPTDLTPATPEEVQMDNHYSIGMFDNLSEAEHAVNDAVSAGVEKRDITIVVSDDLPGRELPCDITVVHPAADTQRGYLGGAVGGAVGAFIGSIMMYFSAHQLHITTSPDVCLAIGAVCGALIGVATGAVAARFMPLLMARFSRRMAPKQGCQGLGFDTQRSMIAGAIGGLFGSFAGILSSYLVGIPDLHYFVGMGLYAGAAATVVGSLVGGMSGRGLSPHALGMYEELADASEAVLVSINCTPAKRSEIEALLLNDGAKFVRVA